MKNISTVFILFTLTLSQTASACSYAPPPYHPHEYRDADNVIVLNADKIIIKAPINPIKLTQFLIAKSSNKKIDDKISKTQKKLDHINNSESFVTQIEQLEKLEAEINQTGQYDSKVTLHQLQEVGQKIQDNYSQNFYKSNKDLISLKKERRKYRELFANQTSQLIKIRYSLNILREKKRYKDSLIRKYKSDINYYKSKLINLREFTSNYSIEASLLKKYKGESGDIISLKYIKDKTTGSRSNILSSNSWMDCISPYDYSELDLNKLLFSINSNDTFVLFQKNQKNTVWLNLKEKSKKEWQQIMSEIKDGTYQRNKSNFIGWAEITHDKPSKVSLVREFGNTNYTSFFNNTLIPNNQCKPIKKTELDTLNTFNKATNVVIAKAIEINTSPNNDQTLRNIQIKHKNTIDKTIDRIEYELNNLSTALLVNNESTIAKALRKENKNLIEAMGLIDVSFTEILHDNIEFKNLNMKRQALLETFISNENQLKTIDTDMHIANAFRKFKKDELNNLKFNIKQLKRTKRNVHQFYEGEINVKFEILEIFKGKLKTMDTLDFSSKKRNQKVCPAEFTNDVIYKIKPNDYFIFYLNNENKAIKWMDSHRYEESTFSQDYLRKKMIKLKAGTFRDKIYTKLNINKPSRNSYY